MNLNINSLWYFFIGMGLGLLYFGGLWLTIKNMNHSRLPMILTLGSFILRTIFVLIILIYIARREEWGNILILLAGLVISRIYLSRKIGKKQIEKDNIK